ncbi:MAG: EamA family transporter, partial [Mycetocola sp.]
VLLGVLVLRERLRGVQWAAVAVAVVAVLVLALGYGQMPWLSLVLATTFGLYGLVKKSVGPRVDAVSGLTMETLWLLPVSVILLVVVGVNGDLTLFANGPAHFWTLAASGAVTAIPLLLFAAGARRLPLVAMGLLQFIAPILQFLIGVLLLGEAMPPERLAGFALIWVAVALIMTDAIRQSRRRRTRRSQADG